MDHPQSDYLTDFREVEISEYMRQARPHFTSSALCRGTIYDEIDAANERAAARGEDKPLDVSTTFFPSRGGASKVAKAKTICDRCPVQWDCFEHAYDKNELAGVWGGSTIDERGNAQRDGLTTKEAYLQITGKRPSGANKAF